MTQSQPALQVLKSVAATLQRERDYAKNAAAKAERGNQTLSLKVADLARQLKNASSQIKSLSKDGGSLNHGDNPKDDDTFKDGGTPRQEDIVSKNKVKTEFGSSQQKQAKAESSNTAVTQADAHGALLMPDQVMGGLHLLARCLQKRSPIWRLHILLWKSCSFRKKVPLKLTTSAMVISYACNVCGRSFGCVIADQIAYMCSHLSKCVDCNAHGCPAGCSIRGNHQAAAGQVAGWRVQVL